jgi:hypothetical protein
LRDDLAGAEPLLRAAARRDRMLEPPALLSLGSLLASHGRIAEAVRVLRRALRIAPGLPALHTALSEPLLISGDYAKGWQEYEWRRHVANYPLLPGPEWRGEPIEGGTTLVHTEQGLGDCLMLARYLPLVAQRGGRVTLACETPLIPLLRGMPAVGAVVPVQQDPLPPYDRWVLLGSLPLLFNTTLGSIPAPAGYLAAPAGRSAAWAKLLPDGRRIGLVWGGNPDLPADKKRSIPFEKLTPLLDVSGPRFVSLQVGQRRTELRGNPSVVDLANWLTDFAETAAVVANLDLVIAVDTSVAHLAGALGKPVWLMLPHPPEWRWLLGRDDSPWYASARLFRQTQPGEWDPVVAQVATALRDFVSAP